MVSEMKLGLEMDNGVNKFCAYKKRKRKGNIGGRAGGAEGPMGE